MRAVMLWPSAWANAAAKTKGMGNSCCSEDAASYASRLRSASCQIASLIWLKPRDSVEQCWAGDCARDCACVCRDRLAPTCWEHLAMLHTGDLLPHGSVLAMRAGTTVATRRPTPPPDPAAGMLSRTPLPGRGHVAPRLHGLLVRAILLLLVAVARLHLASLLVRQLGLGEAVVKAGVLGQASTILGRLQGLEGQAGCAAGAVDGAGGAHGAEGQACAREATCWQSVLEQADGPYGHACLGRAVTLLSKAPGMCHHHQAEQG